MPTAVSVPLIVNRPEEERPPLGNISNRRLPTRGGPVRSPERIQKPCSAARSPAGEFQNSAVASDSRPAPDDASCLLPAADSPAAAPPSSPVDNGANEPPTNPDTIVVSPGAVAVLQRAFEHAVVTRLEDEGREATLEDEVKSSSSPAAYDENMIKLNAMKIMKKGLHY
jgi:hypothetical protein